MKFFFCETCGKRITEEDLQQGIAHDKQLKGVYCLQCAVGVKTGVISAITHDHLEREKIARAPTQSALLPVAEPDNKRSSRFNLIALRNEDPAPASARPNTVGATGARPQPESSRGVLLGSIVGAVVLVGVGILITASGTSTKTVASHNESPVEPEKTAPATPATSAASATSTATATIGDNRKPAAPPARGPAINTPGTALKPAVAEKIAKTPANPVPPATTATTATAATAPEKTEPAKAEPPKVAAKPPDKPPLREPVGPRPVSGAPAKLAAGPSADQIRFAYAAFQDEVLALARADNAKGAAGRLAAAQQDPLLAGMQKELSQDHAVLKWLGEIDDAVDLGIAKLPDADEFELRLTHGDPIRVGKSTPSAVEKSEDGAFLIRNKGVSVPLPVASFQRDTQFRLAALGLGGDGPGLLRRAFMLLLPENGKVAFEDARAGLKRAVEAGAPADEAECLQRWIGGCEAAEHELAAKAAWADVAKLAEARQWKPLRQALTAFNAAYGKTQCGAAHEREAADLASQADAALLALEPLEFNFQNEENTARFEKIFSAIANTNMTKAHEPGKLIVRKNAGLKSGMATIIGFQAPKIPYGKNFEVEMKVNLRLTAADADANVHHTSAETQLRFLDAGEKFTAKADGVRFELQVSTLNGGHIGCACMSHGVEFKNRETFGKNGVFDSLKKNGISLPNALKSNRKPASADGDYVIHFAVQNGHLRATLNDVEVEDTDVGASALTLIEKSPLTLNFIVREDASEIWLEEFSYRNLDAKK